MEKKFIYSENLLYTTNVGDFLVIKIPGLNQTYLAEIIKLENKKISNLPMVKIKDGNGVFSTLLIYNLYPEETAKLQKDIHNGTNFYLEFKKSKNEPVLSGLPRIFGKSLEEFKRVERIPHD